MISFFFFNDTATTEIYTLSLHDALPILVLRADSRGSVEALRDSLTKLSNEEVAVNIIQAAAGAITESDIKLRSEEHTSELQSRQYLVCRLLLEKKKNERVHNRTGKSTRL